MPPWLPCQKPLPFLESRPASFSLTLWCAFKDYRPQFRGSCTGKRFLFLMSSTWLLRHQCLSILLRSLTEMVFQLSSLLLSYHYGDFYGLKAKALCYGWTVIRDLCLSFIALMLVGCETWRRQLPHVLASMGKRGSNLFLQLALAIKAICLTCWARACHFGQKNQCFASLLARWELWSLISAIWRVWAFLKRLIGLI